MPFTMYLVWTHTWVVAHGRPPVWRPHTLQTSLASRLASHTLAHINDVHYLSFFCVSSQGARLNVAFLPGARRTSARAPVRTPARSSARPSHVPPRACPRVRAFVSPDSPPCPRAHAPVRAPDSYLCTMCPTLRNPRSLHSPPPEVVVVLDNISLSMMLTPPHKANVTATYVE